MTRKFYSTQGRCIVLACMTVLALPAPAMSAAPSPKKYSIVRDGDIELSCQALINEAMVMRRIITRTRNMKVNSKMQRRGIGLVGTAASYLVGTVTGGLSIAAAGFVASHASERQGDDADALQDAAEQRRAIMAGIFRAKKCVGPMATALEDPPPVSDLDIANIAPAAGEEIAGPFLPRQNRYNP